MTGSVLVYLVRDLAVVLQVSYVRVKNGNAVNIKKFSSPFYCKKIQINDSCCNSLHLSVAMSQIYT